MGIRTPDLLHAMQALYQLSYSPSGAPGLAGRSATPVYKKFRLPLPPRGVAGAHGDAVRIELPQAYPEATPGAASATRPGFESAPGRGPG